MKKLEAKKGRVIKTEAYRSCRDINTVKKLPEEVLSQNVQRRARKDKDYRPIELMEFEIPWACSFISCFLNHS